MTSKFDQLFKKLVSKFGKSEVAKGYKTEKEHKKPKEETLKIAKDHLSEFPEYYKELSKMEKRLIKKRQK
jgi:hypothetical protein